MLISDFFSLDNVFLILLWYFQILYPFLHGSYFGKVCVQLVILNRILLKLDVNFRWLYKMLN